MTNISLLTLIIFLTTAVACTNKHEKIIKEYYAALFAGNLDGMEAVMVPQQAAILFPMMGQDVIHGKFKGCTVESIKKQPDKLPIGEKDTELKITEMTLYLVDFKCPDKMRTDKMLVLKQDGQLRVGLKN